MEERVKTFVAVDAEGNEYTIEVWQRYTLSKRRLNGGGGRKVPGVTALRTSDGHGVNWTEKGRYKLVTSGGEIDLTSDDPNAD